MTDRDDVLTELISNRDYYKKLVHRMKYERDKLLVERESITQEIIDGYRLTITEMIRDDMMERAKGNIEEIWIHLEDIDIMQILEPNH